MKKRISALLLAGVLALGTAGCGRDNSEYVTRLEQENAQLRSQVEALTSQLEVLGENVGLVSWDLSVDSWSSSNGATVTFTATPVVHQEGQEALFTIWLEGAEVVSVPCQWDGERYTASAALNAADGYCYYCQLTAPDGTQTEIEVNTPNNTTNESLINMESSLSAYANMVVEDWEHVEDRLTIVSGYGQVQLPQLSGENAVTCTSAELSFRLNGQEIDRQSLTVPESSGGSALRLELLGKQFTVPEMENDYQLDLWLCVKLSNGQELTTVGVSWFLVDGQLTMAVG